MLALLLLLFVPKVNVFADEASNGDQSGQTVSSQDDDNKKVDKNLEPAFGEYEILSSAASSSGDSYEATIPFKVHP